MRTRGGWRRPAPAQLRSVRLRAQRGPLMRRRLARAAAVVALLWLAGCASASGSGPVALAKPTREVLPNGVVLIVQEHRASDVVALQLWMRMGGRDEAANELGLAHYIEHMLFKGTPTRPPGSIDTMIEGFGGASNAYTSYDTTHYDFVVPVEHLRAGVELLADLATHASFPPNEIDNEKKVVFEEMNLIEDDPEKFLLRRLYEVSYSPHPYGRPLLGEREFIQKLTRPGLAQFYQKHFVPKNMVLVVVGAVDPARVRPIVDATFGRIAAVAPSPREAPAVPRLDPTRRVDVPRAEQQAYLGLAWKPAPTGSEDIYAVDLLTYILGDSPSSRLNQIVREQLRLVANIDAGYGAFQAVARKYFGDANYARVRFVPGGASRWFVWRLRCWRSSSSARPPTRRPRRPAIVSTTGSR